MHDAACRLIKRPRPPRAQKKLQSYREQNQFVIGISRNLVTLARFLIGFVPAPRPGVDSSGSQHHPRLLQVYITNDHHTPLPPESVAAPNRRPTPTRSSHALGSTAVAASIIYGSCRSTSPTTTTPRCHQNLWQLPIDAQRLLAHRTPWGRQQWQPASSTAPAGLHHQRPPHPVATRFCGSSQSTPNAYSLIARVGVDSSGSQHHLRLLQVYITNDHHTPLPPESVAAPNRRPTPTRSSHALGSTAVAASIIYG